MDLDLFLGTYLLITLVSAILCHYVAKARNANPVEWGVNGIVFSVLALPFVLFCKPMKHKSPQKDSTQPYFQK